MHTVFVDTTKWTKETIAEFAGIPFTTALTLQFFLGIDQGSTPTSLNYIPDPNKMAELARTGLASIEPIRGAKAKGKMVVYRIAIRSAPNDPDTRDIIEIGDPSHLPPTQPPSCCGPRPPGFPTGRRASGTSLTRSQGARCKPISLLRPWT